MRSPVFLLLLLSSLWIISCKSEEKKIRERLPEREEIYIFPFTTHVDAKEVDCKHHFQEDQSDKIKKMIKKRVQPVSIERQKEIGTIIHNENLPYVILSDPKRERIVEDIVEKMKPFLTTDGLDHQIFVLASSDINAFTIPGGNVYVTNGLIDQLENEDALAYIIGHELGHNENGHTRESARLFEYVENWKEYIDEEDSAWMKVVKGGAGYLTIRSLSLLTRYFNQPDELESDLAGFYLAYQAGYDPERALEGLELLRQFDQPRPEEGYKRHLLSLLRSHPWSEDRYECVVQYLHQAKTIAGCGNIYSFGVQGLVTTSSGPLNIRAYPNQMASKTVQIPKGGTIDLICDCETQPYRPDEKWIYIEDSNGVRGWVNGKYVTEIR